MLKSLGWEKAIEILDKYHIPVCKSYYFSSIKELSKIKKIYPVAIKADGPKILHRTDHGLVFTNITDSRELIKSAKKISTNARKNNVKNKGFVVQEMADGVELVLGAKRDPTFGPVVMAGLGGIYVEAFGDVVFGLAPVNPNEALEMIFSIKGSAIFSGARGRRYPVGKLVSAIVGLSKLIANESSIQEIDLNPFFISEKKAFAVDVKVLE